MSAFLRLAADRINTNSNIGSIPFTSMVAYCKWAGIEDQETFIDTLRVIDDHYVKTLTDKTNKKIERDSKQHGNKRNVRTIG